MTPFVVMLLACVGCTVNAEPDPECSKAHCEMFIAVKEDGVISDPPKIACRASVKGCFDEVCGGDTAYAKWCEPR